MPSCSKHYVHENMRMRPSYIPITKLDPGRVPSPSKFPLTFDEATL